ncbi:MAG: stage V sporulation protein AB [Defluviitaleaceae bacterium]|nr:stage V sporulation protein AB [Defluviitaleaceae bacterium]
MMYVLAVFLGLATGTAVASAVFAFISAIGIVPHMARMTNTRPHVRIYENAIIWGGVAGVLTIAFNMRLPLHGWLVAALSLSVGVFFGSLAMSLAESLDVIPVLTRRLKLRKGLFWLICALALGKIAGSLLYFIVSGFYTQGG